MKLSRSSNLLMMIVVAVAAAADLANASELPATPRILRNFGLSTTFSRKT